MKRWAAGRETRIHPDAARFEIDRAYAERVRSAPAQDDNEWRFA